MDNKMRQNTGEQDFHMLMAQAPVAISVLLGSDFIIKSANSQILQVWGKGPDIVGLPLADALPEIKDQPFIGLLKNVYHTGVAHYGCEARVTLIRDNVPGIYYFNFVYQPITGANGKVDGIMVVATEVTEQVTARRKLEDAEERLRLAAEATGLGTFDLDLQTGNVIHSPRLLEIFGRANISKISHAELRHFILPEDLPIVLKAFANALVTGIYIYEARVLWPDGNMRWVRTTGKISFDDNGHPLRLLGTILDITEQKEIIDKLQKSEEGLRLATTAAELGTFAMDLNTLDSVWDKRHRELFGVHDDRVVDYNTIFPEAVHPDDMANIDTAMALARNKEAGNGDYDVEYRTIGIDDKRLRWIRAKGKIIFNRFDEPVRLTGAILDITEKKQNELRKNDFIAMASHELKTPLTTIKAYTQLLLSKALRASDSFTMNALQKTESQVNKMTKLIYGFLDLAKLESGKLQLQTAVFDLNELIAELVGDSRQTAINHQIKFEADGVLNIKADREKIGQVIDNLVSNAVKYSPQCGDILISAGIENNHVKVAVKDSGIGIKPEEQQQIFQRFYRVEDDSTKGFSGFGIGLYLSAEIIMLHSGHIGVESSDGNGSVFYFTIPV
ncbi:hypothetical protein A0256_02675 [Mucilaginibacter sp. PAMC 26640]|nr:hypothetical protein A0256_02675 [Mucilaginibacter sp. PAMC 26640]